jgi:hypothetical protein
VVAVLTLKPAFTYFLTVGKRDLNDQDGGVCETSTQCSGMQMQGIELQYLHCLQLLAKVQGFEDPHGIVQASLLDCI